MSLLFINHDKSVFHQTTTHRSRVFTMGSPAGSEHIFIFVSLLLPCSTFQQKQEKKLNANFLKLLFTSLTLPFALGANAAQETARIETHSISGAITIKSFKTLRDDGVVKQNFDYSCGAASLATILNGFYGQEVNEMMILQTMRLSDGLATFEGLRDALAIFGFRAEGVLVNFDQLSRLKIPVVVYLQTNRTEHFSVIKGINSRTVHLADPSTGNQTFSKEQFLGLWGTVKEKVDEPVKGKILAIFPMDEKTKRQDNFFISNPQRQTISAVRDAINFISR